MKTALAFTLIVMIALVSLAMRTPEIESEEKVGHQLIEALRHESPKEFSALFPTLADFYGVMLKNSELYGKNLEEASRDFRKEFEEVVSPAFDSAFAQLRARGTGGGIDWSTAEFVSADVKGNINYDYAVVPLTVHFTAGGRQHELKIEKAFVIDGRWKISQYIEVEE